MLDMNSILCLSDTIVLRGLADKFWALDISSGNQYKLNDISYFILDFLRVSANVNLVVDEILKKYDVSKERAISDCLKLLEIAIKKEIVKEVKA